MPDQRSELPLVRRFPALGDFPRATLGIFPTPIEWHDVNGVPLLVKRDDLCASPVGGNKVRGLEWLLGGVRPGDRVLTVGPTGSNHALATAVHAGALGARVTIVRWHQEMNAAARIVGAATQRRARVVDARWLPAAYAIATAMRARHRTRWIPAGGAATIAMLGHVNAGLELADQIGGGAWPTPERVYVPLGTGSTAAGVAVGLRIAGLPAQVVAVRVVPRVLGRVGRLHALASRVARLIERMTDERVPRLAKRDLVVEHAFHGGAYGRPLLNAPHGPAGLTLDDTYSRKAFAAAIGSPARAIFWLTFDGRALQTPQP